MKTPILHLNLKRKWYKMIADGIKKEEYREIKEYWSRIFESSASAIKIKGKFYHPSDVVIRFSNGYSKDREQMDIWLKSISIRWGMPEWGAVPNRQYYVLVLGHSVRRDELIE